MIIFARDLTSEIIEECQGHTPGHVSTYMSSYVSPVDQELTRAKDPKEHPTL